VSVGSGGQNVSGHLPLLSAQISGRASHTQIHIGYAAQFFTCRPAVWGCVRKWCALFKPDTVFLRYPSTHRTNSVQGHHWNHKKSSHPIVSSGWEAVGWPQSYPLRKLFGHLCLRRGRPSGGDNSKRSERSRGPIGMELSKQ